MKDEAVEMEASEASEAMMEGSRVKFASGSAILLAMERKRRSRAS